MSEANEATPAPAVAPLPSTEIFIGVQEGGASTEFYADTYDTQEHLNDARAGHARALYRSADAGSVKPHSVTADGTLLFDEATLVAAIEQALDATSEVEYFPGTDDEDAEDEG